MHFSVIMYADRCRVMRLFLRVNTLQTRQMISPLTQGFFQNHFEGKQLHHLEHTDLHIFHIFESCLPSGIDAVTLMKLGFFNEP